MKNSELVEFLLPASARYGPMNNIMYRGYYRTEIGDIMIGARFFVVRIRGLEVEDLPNNFFFNVNRYEMREGYIYLLPIQRYMEKIDDVLIDKVLTFPLPNIINRLNSLSVADRLKSRVIFDAERYQTGEVPVIFDRMEGGIPATTMKNGKVVTVAADSPIPAQYIQLNTPYKVHISGVDGNQVAVQVLCKGGLYKVGVLHSKKLYEPAVLGPHPIYTVPDPYVEATNAVQDIRKVPYLPQIHLDATMLYDLLKIYGIVSPEHIEVCVPVSEEDVAAGPGHFFDPPITIFRNRKRAPDEPLIEIAVQNLLQKTGPQHR